MKHALKQNCGFSPSDTESPEVLEPGDGAFNGPAFLTWRPEAAASTPEALQDGSR